MKKIILVVVILAAIVTACGSADTPPTPDLTATEQIARLAETAQSELLTQAAPTPTIALAPTHTAAPAGGAAPTDAAVIVPTDTVTVETGGPIPAPPLGFSLGFAELGATNPATVDLSQGPQLVEYFAFW